MIDPEAITALIGETANAVILPRFRALAPDQIREKKPGDWVTIADTESEEMLGRLLMRALPGSTVCGEEAVAGNPAVLSVLSGPAPVWVIDPVDGTTNFAHGRVGFTVIVALVENGITQAGWIHDPLSGATVHAMRGYGSWIDGRRVTVQNGVPLSDQTGSAYGRLNPEVAACKALKAGRTVRTIRNTGCGGLDYLLMAQGETHFKFTSMSLPWDHAAGVLIMSEAGAVARFADGTPYDVYHLTSPLLVAGDEESWRGLHRALREDGASA